MIVCVLRSADLEAAQVLAPHRHGARAVRADDEAAVDDAFDPLARELAAVAPGDQRQVRVSTARDFETGPSPRPLSPWQAAQKRRYRSLPDMAA